MSCRQVKVVIEADTRRYVAALERAAATLARFSRTPAWRHLEHHARHHRTEDPTRSAMHAAYDRRRRARRARGRR